jgi:hypothetical protein
MVGVFRSFSFHFFSALPQYFASYKNTLTFVTTKPFDNTAVVLKKEV